MSLRMLLADDAVRVTSTPRAYLEDPGMDVSSAGVAQDALDPVRRGECFSVCTMDMRLPGKRGDAAILGPPRLRPGRKYAVHTGTTGSTLPDDLCPRGLGPLLEKPLPELAPMAVTLRSLGTSGSTR